MSVERVVCLRGADNGCRCVRMLCRCGLGRLVVWVVGGVVEGEMSGLGVGEGGGVCVGG